MNKKNYKKPEIKNHGNIKKLTKGTTGDDVDGTAGGTSYPG